MIQEVMAVEPVAFKNVVVDIDSIKVQSNFLQFDWGINLMIVITTLESVRVHSVSRRIESESEVAFPTGRR